MMLNINLNINLIFFNNIVIYIYNIYLLSYTLQYKPRPIIQMILILTYY